MWGACDKCGGQRKRFRRVALFEIFEFAGPQLLTDLQLPQITRRTQFVALEDLEGKDHMEGRGSTDGAFQAKRPLR